MRRTGTPDRRAAWSSEPSADDPGAVFREPMPMPWATLAQKVELPFRLRGESMAGVKDRIACRGGTPRPGETDRGGDEMGAARRGAGAGAAGPGPDRGLKPDPEIHPARTRPGSRSPDRGHAGAAPPRRRGSIPIRKTAAASMAAMRTPRFCCISRPTRWTKPRWLCPGHAARPSVRTSRAIPEAASGPRIRRRHGYGRGGSCRTRSFPACPAAGLRWHRP